MTKHWWLSLAALLVLVAAGAATTLALTGRSSAADPAVADAHRALAVRRVAMLVVAAQRDLPGARPAAITPAVGDGAPSAVLADGGVTSAVRIGSPLTAANVVTRTRRLVVDRAAATVSRELRARAPSGTSLDATTASSDGVNALRFSAGRLPAGVSAATLTLTLSRTRARETTIRVLASATWVVPRPDGERIPAAARELDVTRGRQTGAPPLSLHVGSARRVATIARLIDRLGTVQPGAISCPAQIPGLARVTLTFRARAGGPPLARFSEDADVVAPTTACDPLSAVIGGETMTPLLGGARLLRQVSGVLHRRLWLAPYAA